MARSRRIKGFVLYICVVAVCLGGSVGWASSTYADAAALFARNRFAEARAVFTAYAAENPGANDREMAEFQAVRCLYELKSYDDFTSAAEALAHVNPGHSALGDLAYLNARALENQGRWDEAAIAYRSALATYPEAKAAAGAPDRIQICEARREPPLEVLASSNRAEAGQETAYKDWLVGLYDAGEHEAFVTFADRFAAKVPGSPLVPEIWLYEVKSLRRLKRWEEARAKANEIVSRFPDSLEAHRMGGIDGRTEDQAAFDFALAMKDYHEHRFSESARRIETYLENYPQNWRVPQVYRVYGYALYHAGEFERFRELSRRFTPEDLDPGKVNHIGFLEAAMLIKNGFYDEAKVALDDLDARNDDDEMRVGIADLRFEILFHANRFEDLEKKASAVREEEPPDSGGYRQATMWLGIAKANLPSPDYSGASSAFDAVLSASRDMTNLRMESERSRATYWRIWVAEKQGDAQTARLHMERARRELPDGEIRRDILSRYKRFDDQVK